jgi:hypothetical protein
VIRASEWFLRDKKIRKRPVCPLVPPGSPLVPPWFPSVPWFPLVPARVGHPQKETRGKIRKAIPPANNRLVNYRLCHVPCAFFL